MIIMNFRGPRLKLFLLFLIVLNVSSIIQADQAFYNACVQTAFQGWKNMGLPLPFSRETERLSVTRKGELENATTKLVLDRGAKDAVFNDPLEYLSIPKHVLKQRIRYLLFTKLSKNEYQIMAEDGSTDMTNWNPERQTKVLIHGLTSSYSFSAIKNIWLQHIFEVKDAYLSAEDSMEGNYNVIVVDWTSLSTVPLLNYPDAAVATRLAAVDVAEFLLNLKLSGNLRSMEDVHMLGHSLGAHVAGIVGQNLQYIDSNYVIARMTGLDPAGPCFDSTNGTVTDTSGILDRTDAKFVDIIHTNMGKLLSTAAGRYGSVMETGHLDFYPNGGESQSGCSFFENRLAFCSHQKSVVFYAWSITKRFMACPCPSWDIYGSEECACTMKNGGQYFGEHVDQSARGKFYLPL